MRIIGIVKRNKALSDNAVKLFYELIDNLLYYKGEHGNLRLYISLLLKYKVFKLAHDEIDYLKYIKIYKKLITGLFIFNIIIKLYKYIRYYSYY